MYAESYRRAQGRVVALMDGKDPDVAVPACPDWSAGDVVRHLCGLSVDLVNGVVGGFASAAWTDEQVRTRADMEIDEVVDEWSGTIDAAASILDNLDSLDVGERVDSPAGSFLTAAFALMATGDILHHEFDLRNAHGDSSGGISSRCLWLPLAMSGRFVALRKRCIQWTGTATLIPSKTPSCSRTCHHRWGRSTSDRPDSDSWGSPRMLSDALCPLSARGPRLR